jgi:hypothetical protein
MTPNSSPPSGATIDPPVEGGSKKVRDGHDDIIAAGMAETIGNCLEAVDIEAHQRCVAIDPLQRLGEGSPVEKTGRHVRPAKLLELRARQGELMQSITGDQGKNARNHAADQPGKNDAEDDGMDQVDRQNTKITERRQRQYDHDRREDDRQKTHLQSEDVDRVAVLKIAKLSLE